MTLSMKVKTIVSVCLFFFSQSGFGSWFEASGQAVIQDGKKGIARQLATQEAIKQALLFAGASVSSVQTMANGLLENDEFEVRTTGEVANIELIDEIYHDGIVTVSIRADIFPQTFKCDASDYKKSIVTTWYGINKRQQAAVGNMYDFGKSFASKLQQQSRQYARYSAIEELKPFYLPLEHAQLKKQAFTLTKNSNTQFALFGEITEFGTETKQQSRLAFWKDDVISRNLHVNMTMYDGISGERVFDQSFAINAPWDFDLHQEINVDSASLWQSSFGLASKELLENINLKIDEMVSCIPAYGRVVNIGSEELTINIGEQHGVKINDQLTLFQVTHVFDEHNESFKQFKIHPEKVTVKQVFAQSSIVVSQSGVPLANIQPNDFVARR